MAEERIVTTAPAGTEPPATTTHTTVIHEAEPRSGGAGWLIGIVLLIALIAGIWLFTQTSASETAKNNAVAEAADNVGAAANSVGEAAQNAGQAVEDAAKNVGN